MVLVDRGRGWAWLGRRKPYGASSKKGEIAGGSVREDLFLNGGWFESRYTRRDYVILTPHIIVPSLLFASGWMTLNLWKFIGKLRRHAGESYLAELALRNENYHVG